ncbi:hypothetical protein V3W47_00055 [Deinococcus sp. YIM 134068]|uniref:hypothetical protein n=1 Tax=Deinococcus lichenicola TaxID=3118910 RepID=UPI002F935B48
MRRPAASFRVALFPVVLLAGTPALADGGPATAGAASDGVVGRAVFRCQGGIRVNVTLYPGRARVEFAGRTHILNLAQNAGDVLYRNTDFAWVKQGAGAAMRENVSGRLALSGCVQTG